MQFFIEARKKKKKIKYARFLQRFCLGVTRGKSPIDTQKLEFQVKAHLEWWAADKARSQSGDGARRCWPEDDSKIQPQQRGRPLRVIVRFSGNVTWQRWSQIVHTDAAQSPAVPALYHVRMASPTACTILKAICLISGLHSWMSQKNKTNQNKTLN